MKTKIIAILFVLIMALTAIGCAANRTPPPTAAPPVLEEDNGYDTPDYEENDIIDNEWGIYGLTELYDENVMVTISHDRPYYTHSQIVRFTVGVVNIGEEAIVFQQGSGSNVVPDALRVSLGEMTPLYRPAIQTMDLQYMTLEPGESTEFVLTFAPYMQAEPDEFGPIVGFVDDLEFFQNEDWVQVEAGEITGSLNFGYHLRVGDDLFAHEGDGLAVLGDISIMLVEG